MKSSGTLFIGIGVVWAIVLFAVGWVLRSAPHATEVIMLVALGVATTFVLLGGSRREAQARNPGQS